VLILENPGMPGESRATNTLFAGVQMILPGEVAPAHRHVSSAIRFVLDGEGAYTAVEGEKAYMSPGDFVITANWAPHDHGNTSDKPMLWLDVLDFPQVNFFEASFAEEFESATQPTNREDGDSLALYGSGVLPDGAPARMNRSPVINYTYARTRPIVERMLKSGEIDKRHGARVRYANPINGGPVLPTMSAYLALFPKGFKGEKYRATDGAVFVCAEGSGTTTVDGKVLEWGPNDVFVVPPWKAYAHTAGKESVLFSISDRPSQEALGIWREDASLH
jgi:gentisate 1,2-dioxygenase